VVNFASQLIFAIAIGNLDMHAKNVSILHMRDEAIKLAPTYDQVPLRHLSNDGKMALAIGGEYLHANISLKNIIFELTSWQCLRFSSPDETSDFIRNRLEIYHRAMNNTVAHERTYPKLKTDISLFISNLLSGEAIGMTTGR